MSGRARGPSRAACCVLLLIALVAGASTALAGTCPQQVSVAVDTSSADTLAFTFRCRGFGQTFVAADTLIRSISVWVPPLSPESYDIANLFITEAVNDTPDVDHLIYSGPPVVRPNPDPALTTEFRFDLDPPVALPHTGAFFFDVQADYYSAFPMLASNADPYPQGMGWETGPLMCSRPGAPRVFIPHPDLAFKVVFCTNGGTVGVPTFAIPTRFALHQNQPNPFSARTVIRFELPVGAMVRLEVFDLQGRRLRVLADRYYGAGYHAVEWDKSTAAGSPVGPGVYLYRIQAGPFRDRRKMVLLR